VLEMILAGLEQVRHWALWLNSGAVVVEAKAELEKNP
jgi:hypothetical protein